MSISILFQVSRMSGETEIVYEPDTDIDIEEFKQEITDTEEEAATEDSDRLNTNQNSQGIMHTWSCHQCEYSATKLSALKSHKKYTHGRTKCPCDQCDFATSTIFPLMRHRSSKLEGIIRPCDRCEYTASDLSNLQKHKKNKI